MSGIWRPVSLTAPKTYLAALHHHCHAPTCLRMDTYNNATGELLCRTDPAYGGTVYSVSTVLPYSCCVGLTLRTAVQSIVYPQYYPIAAV
jgi:hypothetical protein